MGPIITHSKLWTGVVRVALFTITCVIVLIAAGAAMPRLPSQWSQVILGVSTSLLTFGLTVLFARWDRLALKDVGAAIALIDLQPDAAFDM